MGRETTDAEVQKVYDEYWKRIVEPGDVLDFEQVKKELFDFYVMIQEVPKVYDAVTGGKFSKHLTRAQVIIDAAEAHYRDWYAEDELGASGEDEEGWVPSLVIQTIVGQQKAQEILEIVAAGLLLPGWSMKLVLKAIQATPHLQDLIRVAELVEVAGDTDIVCPFCAVVGDREHLSDCLVTRSRIVLARVKAAIE